MAMAARLSLGLLLLSPLATAEPKVRTSCVATNHPYDEVHFDKASGKTSTVERDDWHVTCTVARDKRVVWQDELPMAHPAELRDALDELRRWMKEKHE